MLKIVLLAVFFQCTLFADDDFSKASDPSPQTQETESPKQPERELKIGGIITKKFAFISDSAVAKVRSMARAGRRAIKAVDEIVRSNETLSVKERSFWGGSRALFVGGGIATVYICGWGGNIPSAIVGGSLSGLVGFFSAEIYKAREPRIMRRLFKERNQFPDDQLALLKPESRKPILKAKAADLGKAFFEKLEIMGYTAMLEAVVQVTVGNYIWYFDPATFTSLYGDSAWGVFTSSAFLATTFLLKVPINTVSQGVAEALVVTEVMERTDKADELFERGLTVPSVHSTQKKRIQRVATGVSVAISFVVMTTTFVSDQLWPQLMIGGLFAGGGLYGLSVRRKELLKYIKQDLLHLGGKTKAVEVQFEPIDLPAEPSPQAAVAEDCEKMFAPNADAPAPIPLEVEEIRYHQ